MKRSIIIMVAVAASFALATPAFAASNPVVFNSVPDQLPGNVPSIGFQATQTSEFGDAIKLAPGKRHIRSVKVVMSSWACQTGQWSNGDCSTTPGATFAMPITLNLYQYDSVNKAAGALILSRTQTFTIKYRPSSDTTNCPLDGPGGTTATAWYDTTLNECDHGLAQKITFNLGALNKTLPDQLVYGIAYNTSGYGALPYGYSTTCAQDLVTGCAYDALNLGSYAGLPKRGNDLYPDGVFVNAATANNYCEATPTGTFRLTDGCWTGFNPLVRFLVKK